MSRTIEETISTLSHLGGETAHQQHEAFSQYLAELLSVNPDEVRDYEAYLAALKHGFSYYYWKWDRRAVLLYEPLKHAVASWSAEPSVKVGVLCEMLDFFYFVVWCFDASSTQQCLHAVATMRAASAGFANSMKGRSLALPKADDRQRIGWLAMYAESVNPMSAALRHVAPALRDGGHELIIYAWRFTDEAFVAFLADCGAVCHQLGRGTAQETILAVEAQIASDRPGIMVSDMNNAIPTALFSRRSAPVQIFLQAGLPAWPVQNLDAVFNSFGFDPKVAGWGRARIIGFNPPWDLAMLDPFVSAEEIGRERAKLPQGRRLIGSYGRLAKVTEPYLKAAERILLCCEDVAFVLGGTGDAAAIQAFIADSPVGDRMHVEQRFVPGHVWGHILDMLLDTWPVTGGESCREMIAKGRPVVSLHSAEMPAIDQQRDRQLVARDWVSYVEHAVSLLRYETILEAARQRAKDTANGMTDRKSFVMALNVGIANAVRAARWRRSIVGRIVGRLRDRDAETE
jgi:hypothetical protein